MDGGRGEEAVWPAAGRSQLYGTPEESCRSGIVPGAEPGYAQPDHGEICIVACRPRRKSLLEGPTSELVVTSEVLDEPAPAPGFRLVRIQSKRLAHQAFRFVQLTSQGQHAGDERQHLGVVGSQGESAPSMLNGALLLRCLVAQEVVIGALRLAPAR